MIFFLISHFSTPVIQRTNSLIPDSNNKGFILKYCLRRPCRTRVKSPPLGYKSAIYYFDKFAFDSTEQLSVMKLDLRQDSEKRKVPETSLVKLTLRV